jgi:hypothetical protein
MKTIPEYIVVKVSQMLERIVGWHERIMTTTSGSVYKGRVEQALNEVIGMVDFIDNPEVESFRYKLSVLLSDHIKVSQPHAIRLSENRTLFNDVPVRLKELIAEWREITTDKPVDIAGLLAGEVLPPLRKP